MRRALATALLAAAALPAAAAATPGRVALRAVSAAPAATAGSPVAVQATVVRHGRTGATKVRFYLSTDSRRDSRDVALAGDARVRPGLSRTVRIAAQPQVPAGQALGAYHVIACIGAACRGSKGTLQVTDTPLGTPELVAAAVAAHRLTAQQGLLYRVFAAVGDGRLPAAYRGDGSEPEDLVMRDVVSQWSTLSPSQKTALLPYFTPPAARGNHWASNGARAASVRPLPLVAPTCDTNQLAGKDWLTIAKPGGHVRIWWLKSTDKQVGPRARSLLTDVENYMWPRLVAIFGREPLPDGHERCFHGIDDKLDIYMYSLPRGRALTLAYPPDCAASPAYIVVDALGGLPDQWELAHELTHAFQFAYDYQGPCSSYDNWDEATATWAAAWLYPKDDGEHAYRWLLRDPEKPLADASYEGWVFPYAMAQLHGPGTVAAIQAQTEKQPDVLHAIDAGVPGGLAQAWPEFALVAWNQDPVEPDFEQWDNYTQHPQQDGHDIGAEQVDVGPTGFSEVDVPLGMNPLTREYRHVKFGPNVSEITVDKPSYPGVSVQAILHLRDGTTRTEDWSSSQPVYCPQTAAQRPDDLVLVVSNSSLTQPSPSNIISQVRVVATNIGCSHYRGQASGSSAVRGTTTNIDESWTATGLVYDRILADTVKSPRFLFALTAGSVTWSMSGTEDGCSVKAGPVTLAVRGDGTNGQLDLRAMVTHGVTPAVVHDYIADGFGLPAVQGTETCSGGTYSRYFIPNDSFLSSTFTGTPRDIPGDGILDGTLSGPDGSGRTSTYTWHLVPDG